MADAESYDETHDAETHDVIVVGSGCAGAMAALRAQSTGCRC